MNYENKPYKTCHVAQKTSHLFLVSWAQSSRVAGENKDLSRIVDFIYIICNKHVESIKQQISIIPFISILLCDHLVPSWMYHESDFYMVLFISSTHSEVLECSNKTWNGSFVLFLKFLIRPWLLDGVLVWWVIRSQLGWGAGRIIYEGTPHRPSTMGSPQMVYLGAYLYVHPHL